METVKEKLCTELGESMEISPANDKDSGLLEDSATPEGNMALECDVDNSWENQLAIYKQKIDELQENYDNSYLEIGKVLIKAREIYKGHGNWIQWLKNNVPFSVRHAQRLIRAAEMFGDADLVSRLGLTSSKAYILSRIGKDDIDRFINTFFLPEVK